MQLDVTQLHNIVLYTVSPKNKTRVILNILYTCNLSLLQWIGCDILMTLVIKRIHNLPPHLGYVSTLPGNLHLHKNGKVMLSSVFLSVVWGALKKNSFGVRKDVPCHTHACSHVCHWLRRWCPEKYSAVLDVNEPLHQLVNAVFQFLCNVSYGLA